jgi:hypothetical protein
MASTPPPVRFPDAVRRDLDAHRPGLADETERTMATHVRPCVAMTAHRVSRAPLRRSPVTRLFGAREAEPVLGVMESKLGGTPYCETDDDWTRHVFLGQIDLAQATAVLPADAVRLTGMLRIDLCSGASFTEAVRVRWFRQPSTTRAIAATPTSVGNWEARLDFKLVWTLPEGDALEAIWPLRNPPWSEYERFFPTGYNADGFDEFHRMLGHRSSGLDDHHGFSPPPGCSDDIASYECLLRMTCDNAAGIDWGTNWLYLLVPREDLACADLSRIVATAANS